MDTDFLADDAIEDTASGLSGQVELVERAKRDPQAFGELYDLHYSAILNYFVRRTLDVALSEELTSNVFFKALKGLGGFRNQAPFRGWLYRIAANELKMHWRKKKSRRKGEELFNQEAARQERLRCSQPARYPEEDLRERLERQRLLLLALEKLPARHREALTLRYFDGLKYKEIAIALNSRIGTAKSLVHRGLERLRVLLHATFQEFPHQNGKEGGDSDGAE